MAKKRMSTTQVTDSDEFIEMASSSQALWWHLNGSADDDGFNNQVQMAMYKAHASVDDLKVLITKRFLIQFESGVIVIKHWRMANAIRKDRYTPTVYQEELKKLGIKENGAYTLSPNGCQMVAIDKNSIDKNSIDSSSSYSSDDNNSNEYPAIISQVNERYKEAGYASNALDKIEEYLLSKKVKYEHYESAFQEMIHILQNDSIIKKLDYAYVRLKKLGYLREEENNENV